MKDSICIVDLETRSPVDISHGPPRYFADERSGLICVGFTIDGGPVKTQYLIDGGEFPDAILNHKGLFVAHNWFFEFSAFLRFFPKSRAANPANWLCTQAVARRFEVGGSRASLASVCAALGIESPKSDETKHLIKTYSIPNDLGAFNTPNAYDKKLWLSYVASDVTAEREVWRKLSPHWSQAERTIFHVDCVQQARGVPIDVTGAARLQRSLDAAKDNAEKRADEIAGRNAAGTLVLSGRDEFLRWLKNTHGVTLPNAQAATLAEFENENDINDDLSEALAIRALLQSRATGKAQKILDLQKDGRVYKPSEYHLAHTGRWQSWGANFFNFSRKAVESKEWAAKLKETKAVKDFAPLMRGLVCAPKNHSLITSDWRGIENYMSLYFSGDEAQRARVENGESPYLIFGEKLFGRKIKKTDMKEYALAKAAVLGLGYGAGAVTFARVAKLQAGLDIPPDEAQRIVNVWRDANRHTVEAWRKCEQAFRAAFIERRETKFNGLTFFSTHDKLVIIRLPCGYELRFMHVGLGDDGLYYSPGDKPRKLYGGKIWENIIQSIARQLLAASLVSLESQGVRVVLHVYDEIVVETETQHASKVAAIVKKVMTSPPAWMPGARLEIEQKISKRWGK